MPTPAGDETVLVIDVGLTAVKAALVDRTGVMRAFARTFWTAAWETQDAAPFPAVPDIWPAVAATAGRCLRAAAPGVTVAAVVPTVAAQSGVCIDAHGRFFTLPPPPPLPADAPDAGAPWGDEGWARFGYGGTLMRYARHAMVRHPHLFARIHRTGPMHAYLVWRLTGRWLTDPASGPGDLAWPADAAAWSGLPDGALPVLAEGDRLAGRLTGEAAAALALAPEVPVATGAHDGSCSSFGAGCYHVGDCALTLSTNFVPRPVAGARVPGLFGYPIRPGAWAWVQGLAMSGRQIDQARILLAARAGLSDPDRLDALALDALAAGGDMPTLPYLARADTGDQAARIDAALAQGWSPERIYLAVIVGCADAVGRRVAEGRARGMRAARFVATGGMTRRPVVVAAVERALGERVALADPEAGVLGAAALAAAAVGWYPSAEAALGAMAGGPRPPGVPAAAVGRRGPGARTAGRGRKGVSHDERFDLVVRGGRVVGSPDAPWGAVADVGIRAGRIAAIADLATAAADRIVDADGAYVGPGWIDLHVHLGRDLRVDADTQAGVGRGVTTAVDAGSVGVGHLDAFVDTVVRGARTRVLAFLNISTDTSATPIHGDYRNFDLDRTVNALEAHRGGALVGVKVMASQSHCGMLAAEPVRLAVAAAELTAGRVMCHIGHAPPTLAEVLATLAPLGERAIVTHAWHGKTGGLTDRAGHATAATAAAVAAGVRFDLGHGSESFAFASGRAALAAGLPLHSISTDLHRRNVSGPVFDLATTMTKMLGLGMGLREVLACVTSGPATSIGRADDLGCLAVGREADITLFRLDRLDAAYRDSEGQELTLPVAVRPVGCVRAGTAFPVAGDGAPAAGGGTPDAAPP